MKSPFFSTLVFIAFSLPSFSQEKPVEVPKENIVEIDVSAPCKKESKEPEILAPVKCDLETNPLASIEQNLQDITMPLLTESKEEKEAKADSCAIILKLEEKEAPPVEVKVEDKKGNPWKIRFYFGHSRMYGSIKPTKMKIKSTEVNATIENFQFDERTSNSYFNPWKWDRSVLDAGKFLDEPSNSFILCLEDNNDSFCLTAYHPKLLDTYYESVDENGVATFTPTDQYLSHGTPEVIDAIPDGQRGIEIQNTHKYMVYQLGYGRRFNIFDTKKAGKLSIMPRVDAGVTVGQARAIIIKSDGQWSLNKYDKFKVQGVNVSPGLKLEYQRGKVGVFI